MDFAKVISFEHVMYSFAGLQCCRPTQEYMACSSKLHLLKVVVDTLQYTHLTSTKPHQDFDIFTPKAVGNYPAGTIENWVGMNAGIDNLQVSPK